MVVMRFPSGTLGSGRPVLAGGSGSSGEVWCCEVWCSEVCDCEVYDREVYDREVYDCEANTRSTVASIG